LIAGDQDPGDEDGTDEPKEATGPWDAAEVPGDEIERLDLGALLVPTLEGTELRLEADEAGQVNTVLLVSVDSTLQLGVFAAPKSEGIWDEVRKEIREGILADGGKATESVGARGPELRAQLRNGDALEHVRFVGVDGPRWFVRGVFTGQAGKSEEAEGVLTEAMAQLVVHRGGQALPVRDPLPLTLPQQVVAAAVEAESPSLELPRRGPEITEIG
jgi:hypothetical protein